MPVTSTMTTHAPTQEDSSEEFQKRGKKRKRIHKIFGSKKLSRETIDAAKAEEERRRRIDERQKLVPALKELRTRFHIISIFYLITILIISSQATTPHHHPVQPGDDGGQGLAHQVSHHHQTGSRGRPRNQGAAH